jgi:hypothetical protein
MDLASRWNDFQAPPRTLNWMAESGSDVSQRNSKKAPSVAGSGNTRFTTDENDSLELCFHDFSLP